MRALRARSTALAALLLAVLALTGIASGSHGHDLGIAAPGHSALPSFATGHSQPDRTLHVEGATPVEVTPCVACLLRAQPRALAAHGEALGSVMPDGFAARPEGDPELSSGARRLPASRAPPRA